MARARARTALKGAVSGAVHDNAAPERARKSASTPPGPFGRPTDKRLAELKQRLADVVDLGRAGAVLGWDQATYMPRGGAVARGRQCATLARIAHERFTDAGLGKLLDQLERAMKDCDGTHIDAALVRVTRRDYEQAIRVPPALVARISVHGAAAYDAWTMARQAGDFDAMVGHLETGVELGRALSRALSPAVGAVHHVMDPLIDASEPGMSVESVRALFDTLRAPIVALVTTMKEAAPISDACLRQTFSEVKQIAVALKFAEHFGYDLTRGRLDKSPHPFCTTFGPGDVRITTRVKADDLGDALYSTLHETGHALYEQGAAAALGDSVLAGGVSPGVHESQSRLWENIVGRSEAFLVHAYPILQKTFPEQLRRVPQAMFYRAINRVVPSLIRTDADELTYNLHVMIRFDLECALLDGALAVKDLPEAWAARYGSDLGVTPAGHSDGCLQDVHWFSAPVGGAFQGYTIGNVLSAQFYAAACAAHPSIPADIEKGGFATLHGWLARNVYAMGRVLDPGDLVFKATGAPMSTKPYLDYLTAKYGALARG